MHYSFSWLVTVTGIQLTKKADVAEKEKNDAVIKYATREAEIMKMRSELQKKDQELVESQKARQELEHSQAQENVEHLVINCFLIVLYAHC